MNLEPLPIADEELVSRCLAGDDRSWTALVRRHSAALFVVARRSVRRTDEAEDLVQEIFLKVSRMLEKYDRRQAFKPWLLQVARNHLIDHHRSFRREKQSTIELDGLPVEPAGREATQDGHVLTRERAQAIRRGLEELPDVLREAVVLRDIEDMEYEEMAAFLGVPIGTVKSRINRGRLQLAQALAAGREQLA